MNKKVGRFECKVSDDWKHIKLCVGCINQVEKPHLIYSCPTRGLPRVARGGNDANVAALLSTRFTLNQTTNALIWPISVDISLLKMFGPIFWLLDLTKSWEVRVFCYRRCFFNCLIMVFVLFLFASGELRVIEQEVFHCLCFLLLTLPASRDPRIISGFPRFPNCVEMDFNRWRAGVILILVHRRTCKLRKYVNCLMLMRNRSPIFESSAKGRLFMLNLVAFLLLFSPQNRCEIIFCLQLW